MSARRRRAVPITPVRITSARAARSYTCVVEFDASQLALDVGLRVLALAVGWISFVMIAWTVWRLRRPQPLRLITPLIAVAGAVGSLAVYLVVAGVSVEPLPFAGLVVVGAVIGLVALWLVRVDTREGRLWVRRSHWFLLVWGVALVSLQVSAAIDSPNSFAAGIAATALSAGLMATLNGGLLLRRFRGVAEPSPTAPS